MIFQEIWTRIAKKLYIYCDFSGGGGPGPLDQRMCNVQFV